MVNNFEAVKDVAYPLIISSIFIGNLQLQDGSYSMTDLLTGQSHSLIVENGVGSVDVALSAKSSLILELNSD